jgi:hypothetical protein
LFLGSSQQLQRKPNQVTENHRSFNEKTPLKQKRQSSLLEARNPAAATSSAVSLPDGGQVYHSKPSPSQTSGSC